MTFVRSVVFEEKNSASPSAKALAERDTTARAQFVVHLTDSTSHTFEYHTFDGAGKPGTIKITDKSFKFLLSIKSVQFETEGGKGYEFSKFVKWVMNDSGYENTPLVRGTHDQDSFVRHCVAHLQSKGKRPDFSEKVSSEIALSVHAPSAREKEMFEQVKNDVENKIVHLKGQDRTHATQVASKLPAELKTYHLIETAVHQVEYGFLHFGKVSVGHEVYVHARIHEFHDGNVEFHSLDTTRDLAAWTRTAPLVFFDY